MTTKLSPKLFVGLLVGAFFAISLCIRVLYPIDQVFTGEWVKFTSIDAYYHMRLVDNLVHNFPHALAFDPFFIYPGGEVMAVRFFDWFLALIIWVVGLGSPTQHTVDVIGVIYPAVLAALTVIPVYFIGKALFNRWAGVIAAGLIAVIPGEYLGRSIIGFTDHHVAEGLFSATAILFLILAIKTARERGLTFSHIRQRDWPVITRPLVYSLLAGFFLGIYHLTWGGALLFIFIIALYIIVQSIIDHIKNTRTDYLCVTGVILFLVTLIMYIPLWEEMIVPVALFIAVLMCLALWGISWFMELKSIRRGYYPLVLVGVGVVVLVAFYLISPDVSSRMFSLFSLFAPTGSTAATTLEMQPFLSPQGHFSLDIAWGNFTTGFYVSLVVLLFLIFYKAVYRRRASSEEILFIIWNVIILVATLAQRRFAYYFAINVALLTAYFCWQAIWYAGLRRLVDGPGKEPVDAAPQSGKSKERQPKDRSVVIYRVNTILVVIVVFFFAFFPNIAKAKDVASAPRFAPSDAWYESLYWMRDNTPEPFSDPDAYYHLYEPPPPGEEFNYPESAYGVTSWWDYGYWISRIAHRPPSANPSQSPLPIEKVAAFFLSDDEALASDIIRELDSSYVIVDYLTCTSKFWAIATWAGRDNSEFVSIYYLPYEGELIPVNLFHPAYYRNLAVRLYNFNGEAVADEKPWVVSYENNVDLNGERYKQIVNIKEVSSYQEALEYVNSQESGNHDIVGTTPFISPIPLDALADYRLVFSSENKIENAEPGPIPEVKIFEYTGN
jgi:oligosaccharyl transferase (archaeosortase A-associated)